MSDRLNEGLQQKAIKLVEGLESRLVEQISSNSLKTTSLSFLYSTMEAAGLNPKSSNDWFFIEEAAKSRKSFLASLQFPVLGNYILMPRTDTYALGVHALQEKCKKYENCPHPVFTQDNGKRIYRPLTFKENIEARVHDYETLKNPDGSDRTEEERLRLFKERWLDSCTSIAYEKKTTKFKIIPVCGQLINIKKGFSKYFLPVDYNKIEEMELDSFNSKYNVLLAQDEILEHYGWKTLVDDDKLLKTYRDIVFSQLKQDKAMRFWVRSNTETDELRALFVSNFDSNSVADGYYNLYNSGSFLLVAPSQIFSIGSGGE